MIYENLAALTALFTVLVILYYCFKYPNWLVVSILLLSLVSLATREQADNLVLFSIGRISTGLLAYLIIDYMRLKKKMEFYQADKHWAAILEGSLYGIFGVDLNGVIQHWNPAAEAVYGWTEEQVKGKSVKIIMPPDRMDDYQSILDGVRKGERIEVYNQTRLNSKGKRIKVDTTISPVRDPTTQQLIGATAITRRIE